jgi:hypothetical protein
MSIKPLPENHGGQILELFCVCRNHRNGAVEIAEASDGAMKLYESKDKAEKALRSLIVTGRDLRDNPWTVETIWLLHKGADVSPEAMACAETGMFSERAVRDIDGLMTTLRKRRG